jgi:hypothetical protein
VHRFALIGKDLANDISYFKEYKSTLKKLYSYFGRFYNRLKNLHIIQADNDDDPELAILKLVLTHWLLYCCYYYKSSPICIKH